MWVAMNLSYTTRIEFIPLLINMKERILAFLELCWAKDYRVVLTRERIYIYVGSELLRLTRHDRMCFDDIKREILSFINK